MVNLPVSRPEDVPQAADALLARMAQRHAGRVPDLEERLRTAGFGAKRPPTWQTVSRVAPRAKSELAELQRTRPHFGGLSPPDPPAEMFWSPGGLSEPLPGAAVERLEDLLRQAGFRATDRVANGFAYHFTPAGLLVHEALKRLGACVLPIGPQQVSMAAEFTAISRATAYVGTATHLRALLEAADALPRDVPRLSLRIALAGAEPFGSDLRREVERRWGTPCFDFYGTAESGIVALECNQLDGMHLHPAVLAETVVPGTGDRTEAPVGELLLTADSDELPLLRFATGDYVRLETGPCGCGQVTPRVWPLGRVGDSARVRGMLLHGSQLRAMARTAGLAACRATVTRENGRDCIELRFRGAAQPDALVDAFRDACRLRPDRVERDDALPEGEVALRDARQGEAR